MDTRSLWLVRHGQASFGKADYDNLSEQGHEQAFVLGRDLTARGITPEVIVSGSMKRHRQTVAEIAAGAGWDLQDATADETPARPAENEDVTAAHTRPVVLRQLDERWDELDHRAMLTAYRPAYKNMLVLKADMVRTLRPHAAFEDTFEKAVDRWSSGEHDEDYPESFAQFATRTQQALEDVVHGPHQRVLVVTSAGPVCWTAANLVAAGSLEAWKHFTLAAVNTGVTRITVDRHGPRVLTFNEFTHLEPRGLVTNR